MQYPQHSTSEGPADPPEATPPVAEPTTPTETEEHVSATTRSWLSDIYLAGLLVGTFLIDQLTKGWVRSNMLLGESIPEEGLFRITRTFNTGSAFGLFPNQTTLLMLASILGIGVLVLILRKERIPGVWLRTSLGLQLGGAAGNLVDRITLGRVTDFIDIGIWPVFNLADSSIMVGLAILAWFLLRPPVEDREAKAVAETEGPPSTPEMEAPAPSSVDDSEIEWLR